MSVKGNERTPRAHDVYDRYQEASRTQIRAYVVYARGACAFEDFIHCFRSLTVLWKMTHSVASHVQVRRRESGSRKDYKINPWTVMRVVHLDRIIFSGEIDADSAGGLPIAVKGFNTF